MSPKLDIVGFVTGLTESLLVVKAGFEALNESAETVEFAERSSFFVTVGVATVTYVLVTNSFIETTTPTELEKYKPKYTLLPNTASLLKSFAYFLEEV